MSRGLLTNEEVDDTLEEVLGSNLKAGLDYPQFRKVMDILEDIMSSKDTEDDDFDGDDDDSDDDNDDDDDDDEPPVIAPKGGKGSEKSAGKKDVKKPSPLQSFSPGQGFGRPAEPPSKGFPPFSK